VFDSLNSAVTRVHSCHVPVTSDKGTSFYYKYACTVQVLSIFIVVMFLSISLL